MNPDWTPLERELARWREAGLVLPLWWRDDDAVAPGAALDRLGDLAKHLGLPVHLAVIPALAEPALAGELAGALGRHMIPLVHGWAHQSHAPPGEKNAEFGPHRPPEQMVAEARRALARLRGLFGAALCPVFVPPWNRIDPDLIGELPGLGYAALSTFTPRDAAWPVPGLARINTHLDPIDWRAGKVLGDPDALIAQLTRQLGARRDGRADNTEPYGILTHHLVQDDAIWGFAEDLLTRLLAGPTQLWNARQLQPAKEPRDEPT